MAEADAAIPSRVAIRELLEAYFSAIDRKDAGALARCFAENARATYYFGLPQQRTVNGRHAICDEIVSLGGRLEHTSHAASNIDIRLGDNEAETSTFAIVHAVHAGTLTIRGMRYDDVVEWQDDAWRIVERHHIPLWQSEQSAQIPAPLAGAS